jgi:DNA polymerase-3 subunit beta
MRFRIERDALAEAVAWVARALPARPVVPVLAGLHLDAGGGSLALSCFDYDVSARVEVGAEVDEPGTALVPGRLLAEITRSLSGALAEFADDVDSVLLTCGSAEFTLVKLAAEEYPSLPELPPSAGTVEGVHLAAAVSQVAPSASKDDNLPMLTGVYAEIEGGTITLAATDRYRLAVRGLPWTPGNGSLSTSALIPAKALVEAARTMTSGGRVSIALRDVAHGSNGSGGGASGGGAPASQNGHAADGMIGFEGGGRRLTARLIGGDYIKYSSRFPTEFGSRADMPPGPLIEAVRRVSLVAERGSPIRLVFDDEEVVIEAGSQGQARAVERLPAMFSGDERVIAFRPNYLLDGLNAAATPWTSTASRTSTGEAADDTKPPARPSGPGLIRLEFTSAARPAVISWVPGTDAPQPAEDETPEPGFRYLVVPLRVPGG